MPYITAGCNEINTYTLILSLVHNFSKCKIVIQKNHTHVKKVGSPQNFFLTFIDELEKQIIIKKTVEVDQ